MANELYIFVLFSCMFESVLSTIMCDGGFCRTYQFEVGCTAPAIECRINNATHTGMWLPSPTICNCCEYCLPFYGENEHCSRGGPGMGTHVGRCGDGLTCVADETDGHSYCRRMTTECHAAQDEYDRRHLQGQVGALEERPSCNGKGKYAVLACVPTQTCFCQSEEGKRIFGEVLYTGAATKRSSLCGCSLVHEKIKKHIEQGVPYPVIGPRCTSDGNFNPIQCIGRVCYCVDRATGLVRDGERRRINLDEHPLTSLECYDPEFDLFPEQSVGNAPYNYTTPCFEAMQRKIDLISESEEAGFNVDFSSSVSACLPDGTYGRIQITTNRTKICIDERRQKIDDYEALPNTPEYESMDCKCAQTSRLMASMNERPVCCKNGNFRPIQCRRGLCRCVDSDGRQTAMENADVTRLPCYTNNWRDC